MEQGAGYRIGRRHVVAGAASLPVLAFGRRVHAQPSTEALPVPPSGRIRFRIMRHGSRIGSHDLTFDRSGDMLRVTIAVEAIVKLGPITLYEYHHHNLETWTGGTLSGLSSRTDRNGTLSQMEAALGPAGLRVEGSGTKPYIAPSQAMATTYWNKRLLDGPMIGSQDGELVYPQVRALGPDAVTPASGPPIAAQRYAVRGKVNCDLWYNHAGAWVAMLFTVRDGSEVSYVLDE